MVKSIKRKILLIFILVSILPLTGFVIWQYYQSIDRLRDRSFEQLRTVREIKKREVEWYLDKVKTETGLFAQSNFAVNAMKEFGLAFDQMQNTSLSSNYKNDLLLHYQDQLNYIPQFDQKDQQINIDTYIPNNDRSVLLQHQYLVSSKADFENLPYFEIHSKYHKSLSSFIKRYDIYDLFLIEDKTGYVVYSVAKEIDYATSLLSGPFADSNIGKLYRKIRYTGLKNETKICDFERYLPSNFAPAAFIAAPIFNDDEKIGTLILQVPLKKINEIAIGKKTWEEEGLGETGETYIVGKDFKMRTDSRFIIESSEKYLESIKKAETASEVEINLMDFYKTSVLFQNVNTEPAKKALAGTSGTMIALDYRNIEVLSSYTAIHIGDMTWAFLAEIDSAEVFHSVRQAAQQSILILSIFVILTFLISIFLAKKIYDPIRSLAKFASELGAGNLDVKVDIKEKNELGVLAKAFNQTAENIKKRREEIISKNILLNQQKDELDIKSKNLIKLNDKISTLNKSLDQKVKERTLKLEQQNEKLLEYAHFNSHQLRSPVSSILGLLDLIKQTDNEDDKTLCLELLDKSTKELDQLIRDAQRMLNSSDFVFKEPNVPDQKEVNTKIINMYKKN